MLVTIIIPFYNEESNIQTAVLSVLNQTYDHIELILVNDGSTDSSYTIVEKIIEENKHKIEKVKLLSQSNQDQLRAIINASNYVNGEYVLVLHADDLLKSADSIEALVKHAQLYPNVDGFISDLELIDNNNKIIGSQNVRDYKMHFNEISRMGLYFGRQQFTDTVFIKKEVFLGNYKDSYLLWNRPFWLCKNEGKLDMLNIKKYRRPFMQYRIHEGNYINSEYGNFSVLIGEIRTFLYIRSSISIPFYKTQNIILRILRKLGFEYKVHYCSKEIPCQDTDIIYKQLKYIISKRYKKGHEHPLFASILTFFKKRKSTTRIVDFFEKDFNGECYYGCDNRKLYIDYKNNQQFSLYNKLEYEMNKGFKSVRVPLEYREKMCIALKYMCIDEYTHIEII